LFITYGNPFNRKIRPLLVLLVAALLTSSFASVIDASNRAVTVDEEAAISDIQGHWAEDQMQSWLDQGWLSGYPDGTVRPNREITRAEFASMVNRVFQFDSMAIIDFSDVSDEWFAGEIATAVAVGYYSGYPDGTIRPNHPISRQEVAVVVATILGISSANPEGTLQSFADAARMALWSKGAIASVVEAGVMSGYPNGAFQPNDAITRAEAVVTLDRTKKISAHQTVVFDQPGVYGSGDGNEPQMIKGDVVVRVPDVTLQNMVIHGNLLLDKGIGEGDVTLNHVTVYGLTTVNGGGSNSVHVNHSTLNQVVIDKADGNIRVVVSGTTVVREVILYSGANLEEADLSDEGFGPISIVLTNDGNVILSGDFEHVRVQTPGVSVEIRSGSVQNLDIDEQAEGTKVHVQNAASVARMILNAASDVTGNGIIHIAEVNAEGSIFERKPNELVSAGQAGSAPIGNQGGTPTTPPVIIPPGNDGGNPDDHNEEALPANWVSGEAAVVPDFQGSGQAAVARKYSLMYDGAKIDLSGSTIAIEGQETKNLLDYPHEDFWISLSEDTTDLHLRITTKQGVKYEATIEWEQATEATVTFQGPPQAGAVFTGKDAFDHARIDFREVQANQLLDWTSVKDGCYAVGLTINGADLRADYVEKAFRVHEDGFIVELSDEDDYGTQYVTTDWHVGTAAMYFVLADHAVYVAHVNVISVTPAEQVIQYVSTDEPAVFDVSVPWGTSSLAAHAALPQSIGVTGAVYEKDMAAIDWNIIHYNESTIGAYTAIGNVMLPPAWQGSPAPLTATVTVVPISIHAVVGNVSPGGFTLVFDHAVPGLDVTIQEAGGQIVAVTSVDSSNDGKLYNIQAAFVGGKSYLVTIAKYGYDFGDPLTITAPEVVAPVVQVETTISNASVSGFTIALSPTVADLTAADLDLRDADNRPVSGATMSSADNGATYIVKASLSGGQSYSVHLDKEGYSFGDSALVVVPISEVSVGIQAGGKDFILSLNPALPGLTAANISLQPEVHLAAVASQDGGSTYTVSANYEDNTVYTFTLARDGYDFGDPVSALYEAPMEVTDVHPHGFTLRFNPPVPNLKQSEVWVVRSGIIYDVKSIRTDDGGASYSVNFDLLQGQDYTISVTAPGAVGRPPVTFTAPWTPEAALSNVSTSGFTLTLNGPIAGLILTTEHIRLSTSDGDLVPVSILNTNGTKYNIAANLSVEQRYTLAINNYTPGYYILGLPIQLSEVAEAVSASISQASIYGFNLQLSPAVEGLAANDLTLWDTNLNRAVAGLSLSTHDGGATYRVDADPALVLRMGYLLSIDKAGFVFYFDPALVSPDDISPQMNVTDISTAGFSVTLDPMVPNLTATDLSVCNWRTLKCVHPMAVVERGEAYTVTTNLEWDQQYYMEISPRYGYKFWQSQLFMIPTVEEAVELGEATATGFTFQLSPALDGLKLSDIQLLENNQTPLSIQSMESHDGGNTYEVAAALRPGWSNYFTISKAGYNFGATKIVDFTQRVTLNISQVDVTGYTLHLDPAIPDLTAGHLHLTDSRGESVIDFGETLETMDGGATYRSGIALRGGETYKLTLSDRFGYEIPSVEVVAPAFAVSGTISNASTDGFTLNLNPAVPGLKASDITLMDERGHPATINYMVARNNGATYLIEAMLLGGTNYTVQPEAFGYHFGDGYDVTVPLAVRQTAAAWFAGIALDLSSAVPGLTPADISLKDRQGREIAVQSVSTADSGASYLIAAELAPNSFYDLQLTKNGFKFEQLSVRAVFLSSQLTVEAETNTGFTLVFDPAVADLRPSELTIIDTTNSQEITPSALSSIDGGRTYTVSADLVYGHNYRINIKPYGYAAISEVINLNLIIGQGITPTLTETGFTFTLNPAVDGLVPADLLLTDPDGAEVVVTGLTTPDGGSTYMATAALLPGGRHHLRVQPTGYYFGVPAAIQVPPPTVSVISATAEEIILKFTPALPGLVASNFNLRGLGGLQFDLASATSTNGGASYLLRPAESLPDGASIGISLTKAFFNLGPTIAASLPYRVTLGVSDVQAGSFTLHLDRPVPGLTPEDVILTDEQNAVFRPYALARNFNGEAWEAKIDLPGGQTYSLALDAPDLEAEPVSVAFPLGVTPVITAVTGEGFTLAFSPAVDGLSLTDLLLTPIGSQTPLAITGLTTADMGVTYKAQAALTPGQVYDLSLVKAGHDFLREVRFGFGLPPVLTGAFISADGTNLLLAFDKPMAVPLNASAGFTVIVDGATQSFTSAKAGSNSNELVLGLATAIEGGSIVLTYIPGSIQAADHGELEEIPFLAVPHLSHVEGLAIFLRGQGKTIARIGQELQTQLGAGRNEIALGLAALLYPASEIATAVMAAYPGSTAADIAAALGHAGLDSSAVVTVLELRFDVPVAQAPALLYGADYNVLAITQSLADLRLTATQAAEALSAANLVETATENGRMVAASLQTVYGATDDTAAQALFAVGTPADIALEVLITVYNSDPSAGARALAAGGYGAESVAAALVAHEDVGAAAATNALTGAGYTAAQIATALEAGFAGLTIPDILPLLRAAGHEAQAIATMLVGRTYTAEQAYHLLLDAGYGLDDLMQILASGYSPSATAEGLKAAGMAFDEIGRALQRTFYLTAAQAGAALHQAGYSMDEAAQVLHPVFGLSLRNLGNLLLSTFGQPFYEVVAAFRKAGVGIAAASQYLREEIGAAGHLDQTSAGIFKAAGYDVAEVTIAVRSFITGYSGGVPAYAVAARLRAADYTAAEAIQGLQAAYSVEREPIVYAVSYAYDVDETIAGVAALWGVGPESLARWIRNGALVRLANDLPLSAYDVGQLLRDHSELDPVGLVNALRAEGLAIDYVADVMMTFYNGYPNGDRYIRMLTGLRAAGYPIAEIIGCLDGASGGLNSSIYKAANVTAAELGAHMFNQGFTPRQFAIELDAYDALEIALAIRSLYNLDAAAATAALSGNRFSEQAAAEAVGTAYGVDVILTVASGARTKGDTAAAAAWMLKQVYRLDLQTAARNLKGAGYSQAEVLQGILAAYCGEAKWSAGTYRSLALVLTDVYGVVDTVAKPLAVLQAIGANLTPSDQVYMLRQWSFSWTEVAEVLHDAQFSPGASLDFMRDFAPIPADEMLLGVAAAYAISHSEALVDWLRLKVEAGASSYRIADWLAYPGNLGWQESATQLKALGYTRTEVINAIKLRWSGPDVYKYPAWISHVLFEVTDLGNVLKEMYSSGSQPGELRDALTYLYPNMNLGEKALLLRKAGLSTSQLVTWVLQLEPKDESVYPVLKQLGLTAADSFHYVLGRWDVPIVERVSIMDEAGYTPVELFHAISSDAIDVVRGYKQIDKPIREAAYGLSMHWDGKIRRLSAEEIASNLYAGGYTLDQVAYAMAPPRVAYDSDIVPAGEYRGAPAAEYGCSIMSLVPRREIGAVALAITRAKANRNAGNMEQYPMDLSDVAFFLYSCPSAAGMGPKDNAKAVWDGLKAITSTQAWHNSTSRLGESWSQNKIVLRSMLEVGELSSYTAAHVLRAKGYQMNDAWLELMAVGLDPWTARVSVTDAYPGETAMAILSMIFNAGLKDPAMGVPNFWGRGEFIAKWATVGLNHIPGLKP